MIDIPSPYKDTPTDEIHRITARVSKEDYQFLFYSCPIQGLQNAILATLFHKFVEHCKQSGIESIPLPENQNKLHEILKSFGELNKDSKNR